MSTKRPDTESGREAVRLRRLFGGETEERASLWVRKIEVEAAERSAGAAPIDVDVLAQALHDDWEDRHALPYGTPWACSQDAETRAIHIEKYLPEAQRFIDRYASLSGTDR